MKYSDRTALRYRIKKKPSGQWTVNRKKHSMKNLHDFTPDPKEIKSKKSRAGRQQEKAYAREARKSRNPEKYGLLEYVSPISGDEEGYGAWVTRYPRSVVKHAFSPETGEFTCQEYPFTSQLENHHRYQDEYDDEYGYVGSHLNDDFEELQCKEQEDFDEWFELSALDIWENDLDKEFKCMLSGLSRLFLFAKNRESYFRALSRYDEIAHSAYEWRADSIHDLYLLVQDMHRWISELSAKISSASQAHRTLSLPMNRRCLTTRARTRSCRSPRRSSFAVVSGSPGDGGGGSGSGDPDQPKPPERRLIVLPSFLFHQSKGKKNSVPSPWRPLGCCSVASGRRRAA